MKNDKGPTAETTVEFGRRLQAWLDAKGMTQCELAQALGMHPSQLSRIIRGAVDPSWTTGERLRILMAEDEARDPEAALEMTLARLFPDQRRRRLVLDLVKTIRASNSNNAVDNGGDLASTPPNPSHLRRRRSRRIANPNAVDPSSPSSPPRLKTWWQGSGALHIPDPSLDRRLSPLTSAAY